MFTLGGGAVEWIRLASNVRNDFIARTMSGAFNTSGNTFEYVRRTKALVAMWDSIRDLSAPDRDDV